jgi:hypothetical protein
MVDLKFQIVCMQGREELRALEREKSMYMEKKERKKIENKERKRREREKRSGKKDMRGMNQVKEK